MTFFTELDQIILKLVWNAKDNEQPKQSGEKKNGAREIMLPDFRLYNKDTVIKTVW